MASFHQRFMSWRQLESVLSRRGHTTEPSSPVRPDQPEQTHPGTQVSFAELHCHSHYSFLDGASSPEDLVAEAAGLGLSALAITDHDGMYGAVRFAEAAREAGMPTVFGAELNMNLSGERT